MMQIALIGLGAGAATALLFASVKSGALLSILLFYIAPLPILIAALGWSHLAGLIAAIVAALALAFTFGWTFFLVFLIGVGLPAWWLGYLTMLARPAADGAALEWYPPGRLVVWCAVLGALIVIAAIPTFGTDEQSFNAALRAAFEQFVRVTPDRPVSGDDALAGIDKTRLIDFLVMVIPSTAAVLATMTNTINLWIAARIVRLSGRLNRPWPDLAAMEFPKLVAGVLLAAIVVSLFGGLAGIAATVLSASLLVAFAILGFAVLHAITRGRPSRPFLLSGVYAATLLFGWPMLVMTLLGLAEAAFQIRARAARKAGPPMVS